MHPWPDDPVCGARCWGRRRGRKGWEMTRAARTPKGTCGGLCETWSPSWRESRRSPLGPKAKRTGKGSLVGLDTAVCWGPRRGTRSQWESHRWREGSTQLGAHQNIAPLPARPLSSCATLGRLLCSAGAGLYGLLHKRGH